MHLMKNCSYVHAGEQAEQVEAETPIFAKDRGGVAQIDMWDNNSVSPVVQQDQPNFIAREAIVANGTPVMVPAHGTLLSYDCENCSAHSCASASTASIIVKPQEG